MPITGRARSFKSHYSMAQKACGCIAFKSICSCFCRFCFRPELVCFTRFPTVVALLRRLIVRRLLQSAVAVTITLTSTVTPAKSHRVNHLTTVQTVCSAKHWQHRESLRNWSFSRDPQNGSPWRQTNRVPIRCLDSACLCSVELPRSPDATRMLHKVAC